MHGHSGIQLYDSQFVQRSSLYLLHCTGQPNTLRDTLLHSQQDHQKTLLPRASHQEVLLHISWSFHQSLWSWPHAVDLMGWLVLHKRGRGDHCYFCSFFGTLVPCVVSSRHMRCLTLLLCFSSSRLVQVWVCYIGACSSCGSLLCGVQMLLPVHHHRSVTHQVSWASIQHCWKQSHPSLNWHNRPPHLVFFLVSWADEFLILVYLANDTFLPVSFQNRWSFCRGLTNFNFEDIVNMWLLQTVPSL